MIKQIFVLVSLSLALIVTGCGSSSDNDRTPITIESLSHTGTLDVGQGGDVLAYKNYLFYIGWSSNADTFGIVDFSDPADPQLLSSLDMGSAYGIAFDGRYAYVETDGGGSGDFATTGSMFAIDCDDFTNPLYSDDNAAGYKSAYSNYLYGDILFNFSDSIIGVYDVSTPGQLNWLYNIPSDDAEFGDIQGSKMAMTGADTFTLFDISNSATETTVLGTYNFEGNRSAYGAALDGNTAYTFNGDSVADDRYVYALDISDPANISVISTVPVDIDAGYKFMVIDDYLLLTGTKSFIVVDISDPENMVVVDSITFSEYTWGFDVIGNYAIVAASSTFEIVELQ